MRRILGYVFITALLSILSIIYYTFYWKIYIPKLPTEPSVKYIITTGHFLFIMELWCLLSAITSEPGKVPPYWGFYNTNDETRQKRYCMLCHVFKPERCHHCSACNRCVLNMDHHCPWINNCVGFLNRKTFILLLFYSLGNLYFIFLFMCPVILDIILTIYESRAAVNFFPHFQYVGVFLLVCFLMVILTFFTKFHVKLVLSNSTTIENFEKSSEPSVYDAGRSKNWRQVFGKNPWLWFAPVYGSTGKPDGDGVVWPQTYKVNDNREGFERDDVRSVAESLHLDNSKDKSKISDSDTSFLSHKKK